MSELFVTIPHSGWKIPPEAVWLKSLPHSVLRCDVDAFVDELHEPVIKQLNVTAFLFPWHRYAVDVNRLPEDRTNRTVEESPFRLSHETPTEIHWHQTTRGDLLIKKPLSKKRHQQLMDRYYHPFHQKIRDEFKKRKKRGRGGVYHLDLHSMPSVGRTLHKDPGQKRAQIVIGNREGHSAENRFSKLILSSYEKAGFKVALNHPYRGGRITELYGQPKKGQHTIQVEINRSLYMNEKNGLKSVDFAAIQKQLNEALTFIVKGIETS